MFINTSISRPRVHNYPPLSARDRRKSGNKSSCGGTAGSNRIARELGCQLVSEIIKRMQFAFGTRPFFSLFFRLSFFLLLSFFLVFVVVVVVVFFVVFKVSSHQRSRFVSLVHSQWPTPVLDVSWCRSL